MTSKPSPKNRRSTGRITLADVAQKVGVGKMTVSRALRTPELVSPPLREKIDLVVKQLGYIPNIAARQLASASSKTLLIVTSSITSTENSLILSALQKSLAPLKLQFIILLAEENDWLPELINHAPIAIVLLNLNCPQQNIDWIRYSQIPTIEIGVKQSNPVDMNIGVNSASAMQTMIHFLIKKGHKEIGLLTSKQNFAIFQHYLTSWHTALLAAHINPHLIHYSEAEISFSTGAKLFNEALLTWGNIDVLVFMSDELACGALCEAHRRYISIPHDIAIVSLGGLDVGSVCYPRLTTLSIPYEKMGILAAQQLTERLTKPENKHKNTSIEIPFSLIERDSA